MWMPHGMCARTSRDSISCMLVRDDASIAAIVLDRRPIGADRCTGPNRHAHVHHSSERRRFFGSPGTVAIDEVLALESHAMLNRHPTAERLDALQVACCDGLCVIQEPT